MNLKIQIRTLLISAMAALGTLIPAQGATGAWKTYTSMDCAPKKIMAGDRYTYFWVNQGYHSGLVSPFTAHPYRNPLGGMLFYDSQNPGHGIRSIHELGELNPTAVMHASYCASGKYLLLTYADNGIDIITDSGTIHRINDLRDTNGAESLEVKNVTFSLDDNDAWIGTSTGIIRIDGSTFRIKNRMRTQEPVYAACQVGDKILACVGADLRYAPEDTPLVALDEFQKLDRILPFPRILMPLEGNMCAVMYGISPSELGTVKVEAGKIPSATAGLMKNNGLSKRLTNREANYGGGSKIWYNTIFNTDYENNYLSQDRGYIFFTGSQAYWLGKSPAAGKINLKNVSLPQTDTYVLGSPDFDTFWFYEFRKGFRQDKRGESGWTAGTPLSPSVPAPVGGMTIRYSPKFGVICENKRVNWDYSYPERIEPMLISGYKEGKWTNYSPSHIVPDAIKNNADLLNTYNQYNGTPNTYPLSSPWDLEIDPVYPDYVWTAGWWDGIAAVNLANPSGQILHFGDTKGGYVNAQFPGFKAEFSTDWASYAHVAGFDEKGTLLSYVAMTQPPRVYYWTAEDRKAALENQDITKCEGFNYINLPIPTSGWTTKSLVLKHPKNQGKMILDPGDWVSFYIFDHKGTLEDSSDDTVDHIEKLQGPEGENYYADRAYCWAEDPVTGDLLLGTSSAFFRIDLTKPVKDGSIACEVVSVAGDGGHKEAISPSTCVEAICFDEYNRMWVGLQCGGVVGLSADRSKVVARYDMSNSPMPSNSVYGLCWNPESKELFISTAGSLCSVKPDLEPETATLGGMLEAYARPSSVTPDYAGAVDLYNIPAHSILTVYDRDGNRVKAIAGSVDFHAVWNLDNEEGRRVESGMYLIKDATGMIPDMEIFVMK